MEKIFDFPLRSRAVENAKEELKKELLPLVPEIMKKFIERRAEDIFQRLSRFGGVVDMLTEEELEKEGFESFDEFGEGLILLEEEWGRKVHVEWAEGEGDNRGAFYFYLFT